MYDRRVDSNERRRRAATWSNDGVCKAFLKVFKAVMLDIFGNWQGVVKVIHFKAVTMQLQSCDRESWSQNSWSLMSYFLLVGWPLVMHSVAEDLRLLWEAVEKSALVALQSMVRQQKIEDWRWSVDALDFGKRSIACSATEGDLRWNFKNQAMSSKAHSR